MENLQPKELIRKIEEFLGEELEPFPTIVQSVFGQTIQVIENNRWSHTLVFEHIGYGIIKIPWRQPFHSNEYLNWFFRSWALDRIRSHVDLRPVTLAQGLFFLQPTLETNPEKLERIIFYFALKECTEAALLGKKEVAIAMRVMYRWGLEENLPGFNEHSDLELAQIKVNSPDNRYLVTMRDTTLGPLTRAQLSLAENQLISKETVTTDQRALFLLGRDWGLRPIQMALMRTSDFGNDQGGPFIMVPSVKGIRRSKLRRHPSNMLKRYVADDTAEALQAQCRAAESLVKEAIPRIRELCRAHGIKEQTLPTPLFPSPNRTPARLLRYLQSPKLVQYTLHVDSHRISHTIKSLTWTLGIRNPHSNSTDENGYMQITAYRLRRTKGTSMVLSGATPEEVAEALDHQNISSIAHYFRYNLELQDFINRVHIASPEIRAAVEMWDGRFLEEVDDDSTYRSISNLGKCSRPTPCPYHPTVTCYACSSFMPSRYANHETALESIENFQSMLARASTGPIAQQVESAVYGAKAILIAVKELS